MNAAPKHGEVTTMSERRADHWRVTATMHVDPRQLIYRRDDPTTPQWLRELRRDKREQVL